MADPVIDPTPNPAPTPAPAPSPSPAPAPAPETQEVKVFDAEYVKQLREEAANNRVKAKEFETKHSEATAQIEQLQTSTRNSALKAAVAASPHKVANIDDALVLMDKSKITFDEKTGEPSGVDDVLKALLEAKPYLTGTVSTSATNPGRSSVTDQERDAAQFAATGRRNSFRL